MTTDERVLAAQERVAIRRQAEREARTEESYGRLAMEQLEAEVGPADFAQGARVLQRHVESLPFAERDRLLAARSPDGVTPALQDPATVRRLVEQAIGPLPSDPKQIDEEIAAARKRMGDPRSGWFQDDWAQLRYRQLLALRGTAR